MSIPDLEYVEDSMNLIDFIKQRFSLDTENYICLRCGEQFWLYEHDPTPRCPICGSREIICESDSDGYDERF